MDIGMTMSFGLVQAGTMGTGLELSLLFGPGVETTTGADMDMAGIMADTADIGVEVMAAADIGMAAAEVIVAAAADIAAVAVGTMAVAVITVNEQL